jgi:NAD(P)-dependent dehydrogenase (short-subunit alcohol dehydrogenase family)
VRFTDKVLFVTGGASGIGRAVATRFTQEGGRVAIVDLDIERSSAAAADIPGAIAVAADVSREDAVQAAIEATVAQLGGIDCVLNAGGHTDFGLVTEYSIERFNRMMAVHVGGPFLVSKHAIAHLRARGGGSIVNVASVAAFLAQRTNVAYGTAKAAVHGLTIQLALEVAPEIRVNVVSPGRTETGMTMPIMLTRGDGDATAGAAVFGQANMQKRVAKADELAAAILFLLSDDASFITGTNLTVDGGEAAH